MTRRVGLLGGSFNPAHGGHRGISRFALEALDLDEVWWLVSPGNPLKPRAGMAPLAARYASAVRAARGLPIRPTTIEARLGTRYTVETLTQLVRRYPHVQFIWLMGADNLAQFHRWRDWRGIARRLAVAVIARPGYDAAARRAPAMGWLRRYVRPAARADQWARWSLPALVLLHFQPDPRSATSFRARHPDWHEQATPKALRDRVTRRTII
ncbi:nicotinate-nucleotide adenylyltransferase [Sphingomonas jatrophae]|uniref:Probable nicotinate-nucleotide adenylyltransferase n=1 Tax=Sphingomonas jatrophae TaxID=1166337 RepID=A0A1I6KXW1_9SPHN|nr:nicotinate-nucleotide adenylyltransferase [Sphingomonas jatrophae]SFR96066.1 nicotinate-nucleotide adenylyltransferase [Sphingomonas jatrophae]